jgi:hypothetical protein
MSIVLIPALLPVVFSSARTPETRSCAWGFGMFRACLPALSPACDAYFVALFACSLLSFHFTDNPCDMPPITVVSQGTQSVEQFPAPTLPAQIQLHINTHFISLSFHFAMNPLTSQDDSGIILSRYNPPSPLGLRWFWGYAKHGARPRPTFLHAPRLPAGDGCWEYGRASVDTHFFSP